MKIKEINFDGEFIEFVFDDGDREVLREKTVVELLFGDSY